MCDRHGNELSKGMLQNVTILPTEKSNLFSLSKMLKQGWKIDGDKAFIWIQKVVAEHRISGENIKFI